MEVSFSSEMLAPCLTAFEQNTRVKDDVQRWRYYNFQRRQLFDYGWTYLLEEVELSAFSLLPAFEL